MRTKIFSRSVLAGLFITFLLAGTTVLSQNKVMEWTDFVRSTSNPSVKDTFLLQTFEEKNTDNWEYQLSGSATLFDTSTEKTSELDGKYALRLNAGGKITFKRLDTRFYNDIVLKFYTGGNGCYPKQSLVFNPFRYENERVELFKAVNSKENFNYRWYIMEYKNGTPKGLEVYNNAESATQKTGYYFLDSLFAFGAIPQYSLIESDGNWNDSLRWSHLPPARHRRALIAADVDASERIQCEQVWIGKGMLRMNKQSDLHTGSMIFFDDIRDKGSYYTTGNTYVSGSVSLIKTFPSKGLWYFISFPFDVYPDGIDL